jgi:hypothetical protein
MRLLTTWLTADSTKAFEIASPQRWRSRSSGSNLRWPRCSRRTQPAPSPAAPAWTGSVDVVDLPEPRRGNSLVVEPRTLPCPTSSLKQHRGGARPRTRHPAQYRGRPQPPAQRVQG